MGVAGSTADLHPPSKVACRLPGRVEALTSWLSNESGSLQKSVSSSRHEMQKMVAEQQQLLLEGLAHLRTEIAQERRHELDVAKQQALEWKRKSEEDIEQLERAQTATLVSLETEATALSSRIVAHETSSAHTLESLRLQLMNAEARLEATSQRQVHAHASLANLLQWQAMPAHSRHTATTCVQPHAVKSTPRHQSPLPT